MKISRNLLAAGILLFLSPGPAGAGGPAPGFEPYRYAGEHWYGVYMMDEKIGFGRWLLEETKWNGKTAWRTGLELSYRLTLGGEKRKMSQKEERIYLPEEGLVTFTCENNSLLGVERVIGRKDGDRFIITSGGSERTVPAEEETLADYCADLILVDSNAPIGTTISVKQLSPTLFQWLTIVHTVSAIDPVYINGVTTRVYRIKSSFRELGITTDSFIDENLHMIETRAGGVLTIREEAEEKAKNLDYEADLLRLTAVTADNPPHQPRRTRSLTLLIEGIKDPDLILDSPRQRYEPLGADSYYLRIEAGALEKVGGSLTIPVKDPALAPFLGSTPYIQSGHPRIQKQARTAVKEEKDALRAARILSAWIHANLEKTFLTAVPSALGVLEERKGDCKAHSVLFTAMARSLGLPARQVSGLVLMEDGKFYYHQWAEVYTGRWIAVDPVFNQLPADATHITFSEGDPENQIRLLNLIGDVSIRVITAENHKP